MSGNNSKSIAFVRETMLPEREPPDDQVGAPRWVKENLLSSPLNMFLSLCGILIAIFLILNLGPWLLGAIWSADSLAECRKILEGASGACLAVIRDRWHQLLFGFYPQNAYWRPSLSFLLMLVALAPILFAGVSRKMLWFSALFPFLAFWLLWGGSIWRPVFALLGFVVAYGAFVTLQRVSALAATVGALVAPVIWWLFVATPPSEYLPPELFLQIRETFSINKYFTISKLFATQFPMNLPAIKPNEFGGFLISVIIGVTGIALSLPLGILLALGRQSDMPLVKWICIGFIEFVRGVPLITLLFTASLLLGYFLPPDVNFDIILRVIIMVTLFAAAYMAEVIRGGFAALPRGQYEAADALGLDYWKAQRLILLPQVLKISIPSIVNTFIGLFKDTTLVVFIGILDPIGLAGAIRADSNWNGIVWELYGFIALCFFIFCFGMSRYSLYLEGKLKTDHR